MRNAAAAGSGQREAAVSAAVAVLPGTRRLHFLCVQRQGLGGEQVPVPCLFWCLFCPAACSPACSQGSSRVLVPPSPQHPQRTVLLSSKNTRLGRGSPIPGGLLLAPHTHSSRQSWAGHGSSRREQSRGSSRNTRNTRSCSFPEGLSASSCRAQGGSKCPQGPGCMCGELSCSMNPRRAVGGTHSQGTGSHLQPSLTPASEALPRHCRVQHQNPPLTMALTCQRGRLK